MDCLPFEVKLKIINYLSLDTVKVLMLVCSNLWHVCQYWSYWKYIVLTVDCDNVKNLLDSNALSQQRFSNSLLVTVNCYGLSTEVANNLMKTIAASNVSNLKLCARYRGSIQLLNEAISEVRYVDTSALFYVVRSSKQ